MVELISLGLPPREHEEPTINHHAPDYNFSLTTIFFHILLNKQQKQRFQKRLGHTGLLDILLPLGQKQSTTFCSLNNLNATTISVLTNIFDLSTFPLGFHR